MNEQEFDEQLKALRERHQKHEKSISTSIKLFNDKRVRTAWDENEEEWYFSIVDVIAVLTDQETYDGARNYWKVLKKRLSDEGSELVTNCNQLKMQSPKDGKNYLTDVGNTEQILRLIQSIPSPKAEPFKLWLASVGNERMEEMVDPEQAIDRALQYYKKKGYSDSWINQRLKSIEVRKDLTDEWDRSGITGSEYAILTNEITQAWSDMNVRQYKRYKNLQKENLRDNMSNMELILNMLAEASTTEISKVQNPKGLKQSKEVAKKGGAVARSARKDLEKQTGTPVVTHQNAKDLRGLT